MTTNFNIQEHQYASCIECFEDTIATYVERNKQKRWFNWWRNLPSF